MMKTIEDAIAEGLNSMVAGGCINYEENDFNTGNLYGFENGFKAGVEFAQEWISVKDELPAPGITVLIKDKNSYIGWSSIRFGDWDYKFKKTITHWRPITKK